MPHDALFASLAAAIPGVQFESAPSVDLHATAFIDRNEVPLVARALRDRPELAFDFLAEVTAADLWPPCNMARMKMSCAIAQIRSFRNAAEPRM